MLSPTLSQVTQCANEAAAAMSPGDVPGADSSFIVAEAGDSFWRCVFGSAPVGMVLLDRDCRFVDANRRWLELFGYTREELQVLGLGDICGSREHARSFPQIDALLRGEIDGFRVQRPYVRNGGVPFWGDLAVSLMCPPGSDVPFVVGCLVDITAHKQLEEQLHEVNEQIEAQLLEHQALYAHLSDLAVRDPLTGLFNRRYMEETLRRELARAGRQNGCVSLVIMDLDHFKELNDTRGHPAGDAVLKHLSRMLLDRMRRGDIACRYGGEEFVAILPGAPVEVAAQRAEGWRAACEKAEIAYDGAALYRTLSMGVAEFPRHGTTGEDLLFRADSALYMAKRGGRNRVVVCD